FIEQWLVDSLQVGYFGAEIITDKFAGQVIWYIGDGATILLVRTDPHMANPCIVIVSYIQTCLIALYNMLDMKDLMANDNSELRLFMNIRTHVISGY
ncbi:26494_t:CDS:2, partial [Racocetra persica]